MLDAARAARSGAAHGTWIVADAQTAGQGRHGHSWQSNARAGLYATVILRPPKALPVITLAMGLAAAAAVERVASTPVDLRWPNDLMIGDAKLGGILCVTEGDAVLAGFGINLGRPQFEGASAIDADRDTLLEALVEEVELHARLSPEEVLAAFSRASSYVAGRRVHVEGIGTGVTCGLDPSGFLLLKGDDGVSRTVFAGGVRPA